MKSKFPYWRQSLLIGSAVLSWLLGFCAYCAIYNSYPLIEEENAVTLTQAHNIIEVIVRSAWSALTLFAFSIDSNAIDGWLAVADKVCHWPNWMLSIAALGAGTWTIYFIVRLLMKSVKAWRTRYQNSGKQYERLYVFWGINRRSVRMATELSKEDANGYSIFVVKPDVEGEANNEAERLLHRSKSRSDLQKQIGEIRASVLITEQNISDVEIDAFTWKKMGIRLLERYIQNSEAIHVLLLGDDENANIYDALRMANEALWGNSEKYKKVTIHCLARRGNANRLMEDVTERRVIDIVDSSQLAIDMLKRDVNNHPVQFVDIDNGLVSSSFRSLIIGFSECGQDALRFLYEFGAFVDARSKTDADSDDKLNILRSKFYCDIVEKQIDSSAARWMHHAQKLFESQNYDKSDRIRMHRMNYNSRMFYSMVLDKIIEQLNYVVIAVGNDKESITLAVDILRFAIKKGRVKLAEGKANKFRIYVRSYDPDMLKYLRKIEQHYTVDGETYIKIFGEEEALFTKQMLIDDAFTELGKTYQQQYEDCRVANKIDTYPAEYWDERRTQVFEKSATRADLLMKLLDLHRKESQDRANALHALTKFAIRASFHDKNDEQLAARMGWLEHIRWEAAHEVMGYQYGERDILRFQHDCMVPWQKLKDSMRRYDLTVWDTTLKLENKYKQLGYLK